jgi:hypothetical protein
MWRHEGVETTIVSYLTAWSSRDLIRAAHQQITREWWSRREKFEVFVSQLVIREVSAGDPDASAKRIHALNDIPVLELTDKATDVAQSLLRGGGLPAKAAIDALHVAIAAVNGMDYLLTWNCAHIANATMRGTIERLCRESGFEPPIICTPEELALE